jgi:hypothetical protein
MRGIERNDGKILSEEVRKIAIDRERKAQEKHTARMAKQANRAYGAIKKIEVDPESVGSFVGVLTDFDKLARKIYGMDDSKPISAHQIDVAVLVGGAKLQAAVPESIKAELFE